MNSQKLWSKDFIILMCTSFFVSLTFYLLVTTMAAYAIERFQASESSAGLASSIFVLAAVFSRLLSGKYMDVIGRRKVLLGSLLVFLLAAVLYFPISNLYLLLAVRFLHGAAFGSSTTVMMTAAMSLIPDSRRGEGTGYFSLSSTFSTALGPFLGLYLAQTPAGYSMVFLVCCGFAVLAMLITLFARIPEISLSKEQRQTIIRGLHLRDFFENNALPISLVMILMGVSFSSIISFINMYAEQIQLTEAASYFFLVYAIFLFISRLFSGRLLDVKGDNIVFYPSLILFASSLLLLSFAAHSFTFLLAGALAALGFGTMMSAGQAIAIKLTPKHRYGLATSTFFVCLDSGVGLGPFFLGYLVPIVEYRGMYLTLAIVVGLSIILYYFLHGRKAAMKRVNIVET